MTSRFFVGRKTSKFDALDAPLIITSRQEGVSPGCGFIASSPETPLTPLKVIHSNGQDHVAIKASDGGLYKVEGVEMVPVMVTRYVRYNESIGFTEVDAAAYDAHVQAERAAKACPCELSGTPSQVDFANAVRSRKLGSITSDIDSDLRASALRGAAKIRSARWWLSRKDASLQSILADLAQAAAE